MEIVAPVLKRYAAGDSVQILAAETGVHRATLYRWMLAYTGNDYAELVTAALVRRISDADKALEDAREPCDIARAREQARYARMDFERRRPHLYGQQTRVTHELGPDLSDFLRRSRERTIQQEPEALPDCPPSTGK